MYNAYSNNTFADSFSRDRAREDGREQMADRTQAFLEDAGAAQRGQVPRIMADKLPITTELMTNPMSMYMRRD